MSDAQPPRRSSFPRWARLVALVVLIGSAFIAGYVAAPSTPAYLVPRRAEDWSALGSVATVVVAAVAAVAAFRQVREARTLRVEQAQPRVAVYAEPNSLNPLVINIVVRNYGSTPARDVKIRPDEPLRRTAESPAHPERAAVQIPYIAYLAPGQRWETVWDYMPWRLEQEEEQKEVPVEVTYTGIGGDQLEHTVLDIAQFESRTFIEKVAGEPRHPDAPQKPDPLITAADGITPDPSSACKENAVAPRSRWLARLLPFLR